MWAVWLQLFGGSKLNLGRFDVPIAATVITLAVFSCNRLHYLRNCLESVFRFAPLEGVTLLVVDNGSTEPKMGEYLDSLPRAVHVQRFGDRCPGELYRAMNFAIEFAAGKGHEFVHFVQDDCQFLWRDDRCMERVRRAFEAAPDVAQIRVNFAWRGKLRKWTAAGRSEVRTLGGERWLHPLDAAPCDTGITRVSLFDRIGLFPDGCTLKPEDAGVIPGEEWLASRCREVGAHRLESLRPVIGMLPDAAYVRGNKRLGRYFPAPLEFYLEPLRGEEIAAIDRSAETGVVPVAEDFQRAAGWTPESGEIRSTRGEERLPISSGHG